MTAEEELTDLVNEGWRRLTSVRQDYHEKREAKNFDPVGDNGTYTKIIQEWAYRVTDALNDIFPTQREAYSFENSPSSLARRSGVNVIFGNLEANAEGRIRGLDQAIRDLDRYTDLPLQDRLYVEDIDSFRKVRDINPNMVSGLLQNGRFERSEDEIQLALEQILDVASHKNDWGGETNDLYTTNLIVNGARTATAFLLKGNGLTKKEMQIADCGKNGDQLLRLFESPAKLFIVQFVGVISEAVVKDVEGKVSRRRSDGDEAAYLIMDGQDTARVLLAYGKI